MPHEDKKPMLVGVDTFENFRNQQLAEESAKIDAEMKALDLELKREQVSKLRSQINQRIDNARARDLSIKNYMAQRDAQQENCNHHKGGTGSEAFLRGQGDSPYFCIIKHKLPSGLYIRWVPFLAATLAENQDGQPNLRRLIKD